MSEPLLLSLPNALTRCSVDSTEDRADEADRQIQRLTAGIASGDARAIEAFYRSHFTFLYAQARRATGKDEAFCLDVVQEAVLRILRCVRPAQSQNQLLVWLRLVVRTVAYDMLRAQARQCKHEKAAALQSRDRAAPSLENSEQTMARIEWLGERIARFDPTLARMIEMRFFLRWRLREIGRILGLTAGAVDGRLRRALDELRNAAMEEFGEESDE